MDAGGLRVRVASYKRTAFKDKRFVREKSKLSKSAVFESGGGGGHA